MSSRNKRVDAYIAKSADFARPVLEHLREVAHAGCPDVVETIKWGVPAFEYEGLLCHMAAFKRHCTFGFWRHELVVGEDSRSSQAMGSFGRLTAIEDLSSRRELTSYLKKAMRVNTSDDRSRREKALPRVGIRMPADFKAALAANPKALETYEGFAPSYKREYLEWITTAKREATRLKRIEQAVEWLAEGKRRNWKYC